MKAGPIALGAVVVGAVVAALLWGRSPTPAPEGDAVSLSRDEEVMGYVNGKPVTITVRTIGNGHRLRTDAADAFNAMAQAAARDGVTLHVNTAFRDHDWQARLYQAYLQGTGNLAARPGYSNHQGGISVDISTGGAGQASPVYQWLARRAGGFGFVNDVRSEPWHWTYKPAAAVA